jgi:hypothetical protein
MHDQNLIITSKLAVAKVPIWCQIEAIDGNAQFSIQ